MNFLADMGLSATTVRALREAGHDAIHLREQGLAKLADRDVLEKARQEGRVVLTFDLDFADLLAAGHQRLPSVIIFRLKDQTPASVTPRLMKVLSECTEALEGGAIVSVEDARYRLRRLPIPPAGGDR